MITDKIVERLTNAPELIAFNRPRCLRMRFNENRCSSCADICPSGAITIEGGVNIDSKTCTECMLCVSACPSDGLAIDNSKFHSALAALRKVESPVLGCTVNPDSKAHARTFCFGHMSEEHIIALLYFIRVPLQINMTECAGCKNALVVGALKERLKSVREKTSLKAFENLKLVTDKGELNFIDVSLDRRGFFEALKKSAFAGMAGLLDNKSDGKKLQSYSGDKPVPSKKEMLNRVFSGLPEEGRRGLPANYYYDLTVSESCDLCASCAAMCPTGALRTGDRGAGTGSEVTGKIPAPSGIHHSPEEEIRSEGSEESEEFEDGETSGDLLFNSSLCSGCGLCAGFCLSKSISVKQGFSGTDLFEFSLKRQTHMINEEAEDLGFEDEDDEAENKY